MDSDYMSDYTSVRNDCGNDSAATFRPRSYERSSDVNVFLYIGMHRERMVVVEYRNYIRIFENRFFLDQRTIEETIVRPQSSFRLSKSTKRRR